MAALNFRHPPLGPYVTLDDLLGLRFAARELQLTPRSLGRAPMSGSVRTRFRGRGMEFEEVRHYQPGDDIRSIDWRVTARTQVTHTKLFCEERERPVILMVDQRTSMFFGSRTCFKSVTAAHITALMGWAALANNDRVGALIFNDTDERDIRPKRSRHTLFNVLQTTQTFNAQLDSPRAPSTSVNLAQRLQDLRRIAKPGCAIIIISDFHDLDRPCEEQLFQLAQHADLSLLNITDPLESSLPDNVQLTVSDGEQRRTLDTRSRHFRARYIEGYQHQRDYLQKIATQLGLPLLHIGTEQAPLNQLLPLFGKQKAGKHRCHP